MEIQKPYKLKLGSKHKLGSVLVILIIILFTKSLWYGRFFPDNENKNGTLDIKRAKESSTSIKQNSESPESMNKSSTVGQYSKVIRVIDGDTIEIDGGEKVRYIGVNTPETVNTKTIVECFGKEASDKNKELVEGKPVRLEKDISDRDRYGRLLRYVYVDDIFINDYLVRQGYANSASYPPNIKYQEQFRQAEKEARENNRGLWESC